MVFLAGCHGCRPVTGPESPWPDAGIPRRIPALHAAAAARQGRDAAGRDGPARAYSIDLSCFPHFSNYLLPRSDSRPLRPA